MGLVTRLAWRSLLRHPQRSVLTMAAVAATVLLTAAMWAWTAAVERNLFDNITELETGHVRVRAAAPGRQDDDALLPGADAMLGALSRQTAVRAVTLRLDVPALAIAGGEARGILVRGILPERERDLADYGRWISAGRDLRAGEIDAATTGSDLLRLLRLRVGDELIIVASGRRTGVTARAVRVVGSVAFPAPEMRQAMVLVPLALARQLAGAPDEATAAVALVRDVHRPSDRRRIGAVAATLAAELGRRGRVETWDRAAPDLAGFLSVLPIVTAVFGGAFLLLGGLVVANTCYLGVVERTRELGVLAALGAGPWRLTALVVMETALLAVPAAALGAAAISLVVTRLSSGFTVPLLRELGAEVGLRAVFFPDLALGRTVADAAAMVGIALAAAILPARLAAAIPPAAAMRPR